MLARGKMEKKESRTWYKFHEGFSNAVRKTVLVRDLL